MKNVLPARTALSIVFIILVASHRFKSIVFYCQTAKGFCLVTMASKGFNDVFITAKQRRLKNPSGRGGGLNNQYQKTSVFFTSVLILTFHRMTTHFNSLIHDTAVNY